MRPSASWSAWRQMLRVSLIGGVPSETCTRRAKRVPPWFRRGTSLVRPLLHLDELVDQVFLVQHGFLPLAGPLPGGHVGVLVVMAQRLSVLGLRLPAEVAAAGLAAVQRV